MNKSIIITGATGGIGSYILSKLSTKTDIKICSIGRKSALIKADFSLSDYSHLKELELWINSQKDVEELILILAAATINPIDAIGNFSIEQVQKNISINLTAQVAIINTVVACAIENKHPLKIIQFDSGAAYRPISSWSLYCASKAYISMFLNVLKSEHADFHVVLFDPGVVDTNMQRDIRDAHSDVFVEQKSFQNLKKDNKLNDPDKVAEFVISRYVKSWDAKNMNEKYIRK